MGPSKCKICNEAQIKYKCSTCLTPYCSSSACLKKHRDTRRHRYKQLCKWNELKPAARKEVVNDLERGGQESVPNVGVKVSTALDPVSSIERSDHVDEPSDGLQKLQLESAASSSENP